MTCFEPLRLRRCRRWPRRNDLDHYSNEMVVPGNARDATELVAAWRTSHLATAFLVEHLPAELWRCAVPGVPRKTVGMLAAHLHNSRCGWIKSLGAQHGIKAPPRVDLRRVRPAELLSALARSCEGIVALIELGAARGGKVPPAEWQNFPTDLPGGSAAWVSAAVSSNRWNMAVEGARSRGPHESWEAPAASTRAMSLREESPSFRQEDNLER